MLTVQFFLRFLPLLHPFSFPAAEGTALCDILANNVNSWGSRLRGDILVNGVHVTPSRLQDRVAYVKQDNDFAPDMSVRQTMLFHAFLREPGTHARARDTKGRVREALLSFNELCQRYFSTLTV